MKKRNGFTLVELLMVISLIAFLITISFAAFGNSLISSKEKATAATLLKIDTILRQRREAFDRMNFKDSASRLVGNTGPTATPYLPIPDIQTAESLVRKQRMQVAFPQRVEERSLFNGIDYKAYFTGLNPRADYESSALLYLSITQGETFGAPTVDDDAFNTREVSSVTATITGNQTQINYFVDAWGQPLRFYRTPTSLIRPAAQATVPNTITEPLPPIDRTFARLLMGNLQSVSPYTPNDDPLSRDADDPSKRVLIYFQALFLAGQLDTFRATSKLYFHESTFHSPLIMSIGPDRQNGLLEPNDLVGMNSLGLPSATGTRDLLDNLTNMNRRNKGF